MRLMARPLYLAEESSVSSLSSHQSHLVPHGDVPAHLIDLVPDVCQKLSKLAGWERVMVAVGGREVEPLLTRVNDFVLERLQGDRPERTRLAQRFCHRLVQ